MCAQFAQSRQTLCDPMDCSLPGSSVHGILQARILEWVAISYSRGSCHLRDRTNIFCISCFGRQILYPWESGRLFLPMLLFRCSVMPDSLQPHGLQPPRLLCPWNSPGKSAGVGCCFLPQFHYLYLLYPFTC